MFNSAGSVDQRKLLSAFSRTKYHWWRLAQWCHISFAPEFIAKTPPAAQRFVAKYCKTTSAPVLCTLLYYVLSDMWVARYPNDNNRGDRVGEALHPSVNWLHWCSSSHHPLSKQAAGSRSLQNEQHTRTMYYAALCSLWYPNDIPTIITEIIGLEKHTRHWCYFVAYSLSKQAAGSRSLQNEQHTRTMYYALSDIPTIITEIIGLQ